MSARTSISITTIALGSIAVGLVVLALKAAAWWLTGSVALYSDAIESIVNIAAACAALIAIWYSQRPADDTHPFGHHKAEYFSVVLEGVLIIVAALAIINEAWQAIQAPRTIEDPGLGIAVNMLASAINAIWCWVLIREGRRRGSPALVADGTHLLSDVTTSVGVVAGVGLAVVTGWHILDPLLAGVVALIILWQGWRIIRVSVGGLMDEAVSTEQLDRIRSVISENAAGAIEAHDVKTRSAGRRTFIEFHLVVPGSMAVSESHDICDRIERALSAEVADAHISIHVEPEEKAKHTGVVVL